jgi:hypothetical protein
MKKLLTLTTLFFPALLFAQEKTGSFIKEHLYVKASPTLLAIGITDHMRPRWEESFPTAAIFGSVGAKIRYAALGFSAGYFKTKPAGPITPLGVDLTLTDFKRKKAFPVITAQWHRTQYKDNYTIGRGGRSTFYFSGKDMYSISGGLAFRAFKKSKILVTLGYSKLKVNTTLFTRYENTPGPTYYKRDDIKMIALAASIVL